MTATRPESVEFLDEFAESSAYQSGQQYEYLDRYRRVSVGPSVSLVFENHKTLSFRIREVEGLSRQYAPVQIRRMLDWYESLMPTRDRFTAAITVRHPRRRPNAAMNHLADSIADGQIVLQLGDREVIGDILPMRAGDRILGATFWVSFELDEAARSALENFALPAVASVISDDYVWDSEPLSYEVRHSLTTDR